jgi:chromosome segregation ATPase
MLRALITVGALLIIAPGLSAAQDSPRRPWGQVYQEDIRDLEGAHETPEGYYVDGVRVSGEAYTLHRELSEMRQGMEEVRELIRESNQALIESQMREEEDYELRRELGEMRQALRELRDVITDLNRTLLSNQGQDVELYDREGELRQMRQELQKLRAMVLGSGKTLTEGQPTQEKSPPGE